MNRRWLVAAAIIAGLVFVIGGPLTVILTSDTKPEPAAPGLDLASKVSDRFLDQYLDPDGRVVRRDQGNDTVSEGQAYAMLISVATGDRQRFDSSWKWSKDNLRQPSGLFAWKWANGRIVDAEPATDADLDMARALSIAAQRFNVPAYATEGRVLARAIVDNQLAYEADGDPVMVAGPWARTAPYFINPSYHSPRAEQELSKLTSDSRWQDVIEHQREIIDALDGTPESPLLPPDWAKVSLDGTVTPSSSPDGKTQPRYSWDAARTPIRLAESCNQADRDQAAQMWRLLNKSRQAKGSVGITLNGDVQDRSPTALGSVAGAAGAKAAGDEQQATTLLDVAERIDTQQGTYYGAAWVALGRIMLTTNWLGNC